MSIAVLWKFLFKTEGLVNIMLGALGIPAFNWLGNPDGAFFVIVLLRVWQFGSPMVIFLAALKGVQGDRSTVDSETEKAALEEALELVQQAKEKCRMVQEESMQALFTRGMKMQ